MDTQLIDPSAGGHGWWQEDSNTNMCFGWTVCHTYAVCIPS